MSPPLLPPGSPANTSATPWASTRSPRLSWWANDPRPGARQTVYRVRVGRRPEEANHWDTGRVERDQTAHLTYAGAPLRSGERAWRPVFTRWLVDLAALGAERYLTEEIDPAIRSMQTHGFETRSFAYPRSRRTSETDAALLQRFSRLRTGLTAPGAMLDSLDGCLMPMTECSSRRLLTGKSIDEVGIQDAARRAHHPSRRNRRVLHALRTRHR